MWDSGVPLPVGGAPGRHLRTHDGSGSPLEPMWGAAMSESAHNPGGWPAAPPPPVGLGIRRTPARPTLDADPIRPAVNRPRGEASAPSPHDASPSRTHSFNAELDLAELDDRDRPCATWSARARQLSRSKLTFVSRRMCYTGRMVVVAVHLIDDEPVPLFGQIGVCEYEGEGMYRVEIDLLPCPDTRPVREWLVQRAT